MLSSVTKIVRSQRLPWTQVLNRQNFNKCLKVYRIVRQWVSELVIRSPIELFSTAKNRLCVLELAMRLWIMRISTNMRLYPYKVSLFRWFPVSSWLPLPPRHKRWSAHHNIGLLIHSKSFSVHNNWRKKCKNIGRQNLRKLRFFLTRGHIFWENTM